MPELFELSLLGGAIERRYRRLRPELDAMPWRTLDPARYPKVLVERGRRFWTQAALLEHRTGAAVAETVGALIAARAPLDLVAHCSRFLLDEVAHTELCARVANQLGGGAAIEYSGASLLPQPTSEAPLARAAELAVRVFCVGEAFSVAMQRATARATRQPLLKAVLERLAKDEAAHGAFGWLFLDWAADQLDAEVRARLRVVAQKSIAELEGMWRTPLAARPRPEATLGWLPLADYRRRAVVALDEEVRGPLRARGLLD